MLDFEMEQSEKLKKAFYEGYEAGKKDAEYYVLHCGDTDEPETNADRIRQMTDEELAEWFGKIQYDTAYYCDGKEQKYPFPDGWIDWLRQECE